MNSILFQGLYYSYFKTMIEADSVTQGVQNLAHNNLTEFPDKINVLKRFNVYPELALGWLYRIFTHFSEKFGYQTMTCWRTDRYYTNNMLVYAYRSKD